MVKIDAFTGDEVHRGSHIRKAVLALSVHARNGLLGGDIRGQVARNDAGKDDVHGLAHDLRGYHGQEDADDIHCRDGPQVALEGSKQGEKAFGGGPEILGLAGCGAAHRIKTGIRGLGGRGGVFSH